MTNDGSGSGGSARTGSGRATKVLAGIVVAVVTAFAVAIATGAGEATWKWIGGLWAGPEPTESPTPFQTPDKTPESDTEPTKTPGPVQTETGYPLIAGDYCDSFVRAWQNGHRERALDLSNSAIVDAVWQTPAPTNYRNQWGPAAKGALCNILDLDRGNALAVELTVGGQTTTAHAITAARLG